MPGERPFEHGLGSGGEPVDGGELLVQVGMQLREHPRDVLAEQQPRVPGDDLGRLVEVLPPAARVGLRRGDVDEAGLGAGRGDLGRVEGLARSQEVDPGVDEAEIKRVARQQVQQGGRPDAVVEAVLPPQGVVRSPRRLPEPLQVVEPVRPVDGERLGLRRRRDVDEVTLEQLRLADNSLPRRSG